MKQIVLLLLLSGFAFAADKSPLVLDAANRPTPLLAGDLLRLPVAGPFYTSLTPQAGANSVITFPATSTLAGLGLAQTFSGADVFTGGATFSTAGLTITDVNVALGTSTGTKIGTSTSQKLAFYNSTPIVQPSSTTDLRAALINLGLYATGGASPLDLNGGALTASSGVFSAKISSSKASAAADITNANSSLVLYDSSLGAGLFGMQTSGAPYAFQIQVADATMASQFPLSLNPLGGVVNVGAGGLAVTGNIAQTGSTTISTGTGAVSLYGTTTVSNTVARPFVVNTTNSSANIGLRSTATANAANSSTVEFYAKDSSAADQLYGYIQVVSSTLTAGTETSTMNIGTIDAGSFSNSIQLIGKNATAAGVWSLINNTASTTTGNGALVVTGGVGVGGAINATSITCGTASVVTGAMTVTTNNGLYSSGSNEVGVECNGGAIAAFKTTGLDLVSGKIINIGNANFQLGALNVNTGLGIFDATSNLLAVQCNSSVVAYFTPTRLQLQQPLRLENAYVATPQVSTGYVTMQDSSGTTYKVLVAP